MRGEQDDKNNQMTVVCHVEKLKVPTSLQDICQESVEDSQ